jgi:hypothetical protein
MGFLVTQLIQTWFIFHLTASRVSPDSFFVAERLPVLQARHRRGNHVEQGADDSRDGEGNGGAQEDVAGKVAKLAPQVSVLPPSSANDEI